jgi:hypothetical protein
MKTKAVKERIFTEIVVDSLDGCLAINIFYDLAPLSAPSPETKL